MLKILQARLQQYMNHELPDVQVGFRKGRGTEIKLSTSVGSLKKWEFQKNIYFWFIDYATAFDCVDHSKLWKILKEMIIPDHHTCLLRNLYAGQEQQNWTWNNRLVPNRKRSTSRLYIMRNAGRKLRNREAQAGIKIAGRNINNLRYADDTTLMAESEEPLDESEWREWKGWLKTQYSEK